MVVKQATEMTYDFSNCLDRNRIMDFCILRGFAYANCNM